MKREGYSTSIRNAIDDIFSSNKESAFSALEIEEKLISLGVSANKTTIYRYLSNLEKDNRLIKFSKDDNRTVEYKYNEVGSKCNTHLHLQCLKCGKIEHLDCFDMVEFSEHIYKHHGYKIDYSKSILYGICSTCGENK